MSTEASVIVGHRFANIAEDHEENELWEKAADAHSKAAEHFEIALKDAADSETTKTLKLLTANHRRKKTDLNRKMQRISAAASDKNNNSASRSNSMTLMGSNGGLRNALPEKRIQNSGNMYSRSSVNEYVSPKDGLIRAFGIGESYAVLPHVTLEDCYDAPFIQFLDTVDKLSQGLINPAVAFASTPLNKDDVPVQNDVQINDQEINIQADNISNNMVESFYIVPTPEEHKNYQSTNLPTVTNIGTSKNNDERTKEFYHQENEKKKMQINILTKRLKVLEHSAEEEDTLKNSIREFRKNVHQQASLIRQSYNEHSMRSSSVALSSTVANSINANQARHSVLLGTGTSGNVLVNRLKELEDENRKLKSSNEEKKEKLNGFKEKWVQLKTDAKKMRILAQKTNEEE